MVAVNHGFTVLRRRAWISLACRAVLCSAVVGACVTIGLSWMAAWDESVPSPQGLAQYRFVYDADDIGGGESGESRPAPLRWWTALTPRSWHVGPRVWADRDIDAERAANPEFSLEAEDDQGRLWCVVWRAGPGLSDSFFVRRFTLVPSPQGGPDEITWAELSNYLDFGGDVRVRTGLPSGVPAALVGRGTPGATRFFTETQAEWESARLPRWALLRGETPASTIRIDLDPGAPDPDVARRVEWRAGGITTEEVRAYGWPIRCLVVRGWREDLEWDDPAGSAQLDTNKWWSDGLCAIPPLRHPEGAQLALPATGLPWKPLWLPFLANSLILGVPLTLAGVGVSRAARAGLAKFRGRGDRCPRCGYSRKGLARGAACPECGGA